MIDLDPKTAENIKKADAVLMKSSVEAPNVLFAEGAAEVHRVFNTQGYGFALVGPDGTTVGTHLQLEEIKDLLKELVKAS